VVEVVEDSTRREEARARVDDVVAWLARHDVVAFAVVTDTDAHAANQLELVAKETGSDLVVAGAYGHSRLREWAFGGVTRDLLTRSTRCSLLPH
jgi:nucleotide-binding universal stress UspA family protein